MLIELNWIVLQNSVFRFYTPKIFKIIDNSQFILVTASFKFHYNAAFSLPTWDFYDNFLILNLSWFRNSFGQYKKY